MKKILAAILVLVLMCCFTGCGSFNSYTDEVDGFGGCDHSWVDANCTEPQKCLLCDETRGMALGHNYSNGYCTRCSASDPNYISRDDIFPGTPTLDFSMNSAGGIEFYWKQKYTGSRKINYITVTFTLYDAVGNPTPDDIKRKSTNSVRLIGPFEPKETIEFPCDVFVYCDVCNKISFDSLYLEYSDGTTATVDYGWQNIVN
ncbi:MAG: hypothetical protein UHH95_06480 [Oscillospiraceae bacterium]|nr:hypothetical protein [Oscillospiraceae bacterium]